MTSYFAKYWTWTPVTCTSLESNVLKKSVFKVAYKTREYAILNHKNGKFCSLFSFYKNVDMSMKWETYLSRWMLWVSPRHCTNNSTISHLVILTESYFVDAAVFHWDYSKSRNAWLSYTFGFTSWVYVEF